MAEEVAYKERQLVVFGLADELYGIDIGVVREIVTMQRVTRVPRVPDYIEGIINLRGNVIPVVDLRKKLGLPAKEKTKDTRIVIVEVDSETVGLVVDMVSEVMRVPESSIELRSTLIGDLESDPVEGIVRLDDKLIILMDISRIISTQGVNTLPSREQLEDSLDQGEEPQS
ncbi:MAG TPA: chemotaxis protein CheW [Firmicutes bacterium]|nr:chemotaxis protein CheW [Bacillota bacterium]